YWASSRIIPYTINEFPFWSFLYADLHAHVIDLPIVLIGMGIAASLFKTTDQRWRILTLALAALVLGAMACINTWDAPTYGGIIIIALLLSEWQGLTQAARLSGATWREQLQLATWPVVRRVGLSVIGVGAGAILLYLPFYTHFQNFVNGIGPVATPDSPVLYLVVFGVWLFIIVSFFLVEIRDRWEGHIVRHRDMNAGAESLTDTSQRMLAIVIAAVIVLTLLVLINLKLFLVGLIAVAVFLAVTGRNNPAKQFIYLLVIVGLGVSLLFESIYLRDFLDGIPGWERMNTVFKFSYQVWLLFALGAALAFGQIIGRIFDFSFVRSPVASHREAPDEDETESVQGETGGEGLPGEDEGVSEPEDHENRPIAAWPARLLPFHTGEDAIVGVGL
ncbi:MAG TPA: DUF2298 domain-containing protein, partial [Ktedonobacterales bacterium]|nr:DUF2298 domain-containing protein [Ktedonobacterales bacterium]